MSRRPLLIGVTGAIGTGKSTVLAAFAARGCAVLSADAVVHQLYSTATVRDAMVGHFGTTVLDSSGAIDRVMVAQMVFDDPSEREWLERFVHPLVAAALEQWLEHLRAQATQPPLMVYEAPLLFEAGGADRFDRILVVTAKMSTRQRRIAARGALTGLAEREARQWSDAARIAAADDVIANDGKLSDLHDQIDEYIARYAVS